MFLHTTELGIYAFARCTKFGRNLLDHVISTQPVKNLGNGCCTPPIKTYASNQDTNEISMALPMFGSPAIPERQQYTVQPNWKWVIRAGSLQTITKIDTLVCLDKEHHWRRQPKQKL